MYTLIFDDCLNALRNIPDESIDLVVTDPPYLMNHTSGSSTNASKQEQWQGNLKAADKTANMSNFIKFSQWLPVIYKKLKSSSHCYIFCNDKNVQDVLNESTKTGFKLHNILIWKKNNCTPNRWYMKNVEFIIFLHKGKSFPIANLGDPQCLEINNINGKNKLHPTQKPVELLSILIKNSSKVGDIVLDPFMGSGSTGMACKELNRDFIGIELDEKYFNIAKERIDKSTES